MYHFHVAYYFTDKRASTSPLSFYTSFSFLTGNVSLPCSILLCR